MMRRLQPATLAALFALATTIASLPTGAQPPPPTAGAPTPEAVKRADALFQKGNRLYSEKKWAEAEQAFLQAWSLNPTFDVASNLGNTQYQMGSYRAAAEHLAFALRHWPLIGRPALRETAQKRLDECRQHVGALTVKVNVERAQVLVDGKAVGLSPLDLEVFVEPGKRIVEARLEGYDAARQEIAVDKGASKGVALAMAARKPPPPAAAASTGEPVAAPSATVAAPPTASSVPSALPPPVGPNKAVLIAGGATAGVAVIAGVAFVLVANGKASDAAAKNKALVQAGGRTACGATPSADCLELQGLWRDKDRFNDAALWSFVGGGVVGVGTLIYALAAPRKARTQVQAAPVVTAGGGGLWVSGGF